MEPRPDEDAMATMPLLDHLVELRRRLIRAAMGVGLAFAASLTFTDPLWSFVCRPAARALQKLGYPPTLYLIEPMDAFNIIWVKLPILCSVFLAAPWVGYQAWAFLAPGLYRTEKRWAAPMVVCASGLFLAGGVFAYFVVFQQSLTFLLSIGHGNYVTPTVSMDYYFQLFVNVILGVGVVFEMPVLIFFLTALHLVTPGFLVQHSRYAILGIFLVAAVLSPTTDGQPDTVRSPHVHPLLRGSVCRLPAGPAPRGAAIPMAQGDGSGSPGTAVGGRGAATCEVFPVAPRSRKDASHAKEDRTAIFFFATFWWKGLISNLKT